MCTVVYNNDGDKPEERMQSQMSFDGANPENTGILIPVAPKH